ncbi:hypothetical protein FUAX_13670 [Fulvitalea axinellae]|uniref:precorrin-2 dehydrogenase n=1 Tax=Fulvitalea axinellae TaxID=1182444 RepID=A0AAU9DDH6_9BACT|nr:hypothetical protein FUAX_13670 [Fulvitalea axinellae]
MAEQHTDRNKLFPVFLKLDELKVLILGGGAVGLEKLSALLKNDPEANVRLVGLTVQDEIKTLGERHPNVEVLVKKFGLEDFDDVDLVILATDDRELHVRVKKMAKAYNLLVNVADTPDLCDFYLGSTVSKGPLKIGISTNGLSPTFSKRFRELLEEVLPDETPRLIRSLNKVRERLRGDFAFKVKKLNELTRGLVE